MINVFSVLYMLILELTDHVQTGNMKWQRLYMLEIISQTNMKKYPMQSKWEKYCLGELKCVTFTYVNLCFLWFFLSQLGQIETPVVLLDIKPRWTYVYNRMQENHLQDVFTSNSQWGCLCENMCASSTIIHNVCMLHFEETMSINLKYVCCCFVVCAHLHMYMMRPKPLKHPCRRCLEKWVVTLVPDLEQWGLFLYTHHHWHVPAYLTSCHLQHCSFCAAEQWQMVRTKLFV